jgi:small-conductance mechanosensitive channel
MLRQAPLDAPLQGVQPRRNLLEILDTLPGGALPYRVAIGGALLLLSFYLARAVKRRVERAPYLAERDPAAAELVSNLSYVGALAVGLIFTLSALGVQPTAALAVFGTAGLAVSLALQDILRNFVAGIYILLERPFNIGDHIALREHSGDIMGIELRTTRLRTSSGAEVIVPNAVVLTEIVTNRSPSGLQAYVVTLSGDRGLLRPGLESYVALLRERDEVSAQPPPEAIIESLDTGAAGVRLSFWARKGSGVVEDVVRELESRAPDSTITAKAEL